MFARPRSTPPGICPARSTCRYPSWPSSCTSSPRSARSWPIAAVRIACFRTTRSKCSAPKAARRGVSPRDTPSGRARDFRSIAVLPSPPAEPLLAGVFDERTDLGGRSKNHRSSISLHAGSDDHRLARERPVLARIGLETQVELPDLARLAVGGFHRVAVAAVADGHDLSGGRRFFQVDLPRLHHHAAAARLGARSFSFGDRP